MRKKKIMKTRSKPLPIRSPRNPLDPYQSPASLPEEANQRAGGSGVSNRRHAPPQIESGDDDDDDDVEIVTDTFDGKKRHRLGTTSEIDRGGGSQEASCIVCETSDEVVSKCCGAECILWFHEECLDAEFGSCGGEDPEDSFYCPYCWFQILAGKSTRLKEKAVGAEMAVFKYLDEETESRGGEAKESVPQGREDYSVDTTDIVSDQEVEEGEKGAYSSKEKQAQADEKDSDEESRGEDMELVEENDHPDDNSEVHADKSEDMNVVDRAVDDEEEKTATEKFQDAEADETAGDETKDNPCAGGGKERDFSQFLSVQESLSGKENDQVQQNEKRRRRRRRRRRLILNAFDSDVSSNGSTNEPNGEDAAEQMTSLALVVTSPSGRMKNQQREGCRTTKVDHSKTVRDIPIFKMDHKRRLLWTPEEEYLLKVGVEKFTAETKKNMPWRKILEMGHKVFHETRTPTDLKDKWRNMTGARLAKKNKQDSTPVSVSGM